MSLDLLCLAVLCGGIVVLGAWLLVRQRERKLDEVSASEKRFRELTELSADWFWETDATQRLTWVSGGAPVVTFFGSTPLYGCRLWEVPGVEVDRRALRALLERLDRELPFFDLEIAKADARGARQIHIISGQARKDAEGRLLGYRGVGRDVTLERGADKSLEQAKQRLELALDGGNLAEWHFDPTKDQLDVGDGWTRFLGHERSPSLTTGARLFERVHADDVSSFHAALIAALKGEAAELDAAFRSPTRGSGWKWLRIRGRVTERAADGRALRMSGVVADIDEAKRTEIGLREAESRYRSLVEMAPDAILVHDTRLIEYANPAAARMFRAGAPRNLVGLPLEELIHPEGLARFRERTAYMGAGPGVVPFEERRMRCRDGAEVVVEVGAVSYLDRGRLVVLAMCRDVTESRKARVALAEREQRFRDVAEAAGEFVWETDAEGRFTYLSERVEAVLGYARAELLGRRPAEFMPLGEERAVDEWFAQHGGRGRAFRDLVHRSITRSGGVIWVSVSGVPTHDAAGRWTGHRGTTGDVTARKQAESRIEFLTTRDPTTGLANRTLVAERAAQAIVAAAHRRGELALLAVDLEGFRLVNEALGHQAGDALLRAVGERLANALRRQDVLGRVGGGDFVVLRQDLHSAEEVVQLAQRLIAVLGRPFNVEGRTVHVGATIGIALYPRDGRDFGELMRNADAALRHAKDAGRGSHRFYEAALGSRAVERLRLENELRGALARSELVMHWQPAVSGRGTLAGAEALVRWHHPERGLLMPEEFVPLAEACGLIRAVGEWTLERALSQAGAWQRTLPGSPWFAVNVSAAELAEGDAFFERLKSALEANRLEGSRLELEVTERTLFSSLERNLDTLRRIGGLGVRFAIDDFGTGYSSLAYLRELPIDKLKIDRMFLRSLESNAADQAIVRTIAQLARTLGLGVAAEGVENAAQLEQLLALGCDQWQGHYFSQPLTAEGFERLFSERAAAAS